MTLIQGQIVICADPTPGIVRGENYVVSAVVDDPQGRMIAVRPLGAPTRYPLGPYWEFRFIRAPLDERR